MLGILNVETPHHDASADLSSSSYDQSGSQYQIRDGKLRYRSARNEFWLKKNTAAYLRDYNLLQRVFPDRVNSTGKLRDLWSNGLRSFQVDVF